MVRSILFAVGFAALQSSVPTPTLASFDAAPPACEMTQPGVTQFNARPNEIAGIHSCLDCSGASHFSTTGPTFPPACKPHASCRPC